MRLVRPSKSRPQYTGPTVVNVRAGTLIRGDKVNTASPFVADVVEVSAFPGLVCVTDDKGTAHVFNTDELVPLRLGGAA